MAPLWIPLPPLQWHCLGSTSVKASLFGVPVNPSQTRTLILLHRVMLFSRHCLLSLRCLCSLLKICSFLCGLLFLCFPEVSEQSNLFFLAGYFLMYHGFNKTNMLMTPCLPYIAICHLRFRPVYTTIVGSSPWTSWNSRCPSLPFVLQFISKA